MSKKSIKITESQLNFIIENSLDEVKKKNQDWTKSGKDWEWDDQDEAIVNKMRSSVKDSNKVIDTTKQKKFIEMMKSVQK